MPAPRVIARSNRYLVNPVARLIAGRVPPFAIVAHRGRVSGRRYRTPVIGFFEDDDALVVALTYGPDVDWLKNLDSAGGGAAVARGQTYQIGRPSVQTGLDQTAAIPLVVKPILRLLRVSQFARLPLSRSVTG